MARRLRSTKKIDSKKWSILKKSRHMRRWLVKNPWIRPMSAFNYAAQLIQKIMRGFLCRRRIRNRSSTTNKSVSKKRNKGSQQGKQLERYMWYLDSFKGKNIAKPLWLNGGFSAWCAVRIQSIARMFCVRKKYLMQKRLINQVASIIIQTFWRNSSMKVVKQPIEASKKLELSKNNAAQRIQLMWRSFCNMRMYKYFRDLVLLKLRGAPIELLRTIIPNETELLDRAAGVHVKFRLGGWIFPPKVYFKIFTHRPLCDVNAFAPRDYTKEFKMDPISINNYNGSNKKRVVKNRGIKVGVRYFETIVPTTNMEGTKNWYRREDSNNWRPISSHIFEGIVPPPWFQEIAHYNKPKPFHFQRLHRQQDIVAMKKLRKREWMVKLYKLSSITAPEVAEEKVTRTQRNESKAKDSYYKRDENEDLVNWSLALDFEAYAEEWKNRGSSLPSDMGANCVLYRESK